MFSLKNFMNNTKISVRLFSSFALVIFVSVATVFVAMSSLTSDLKEASAKFQAGDIDAVLN